MRTDFFLHYNQARGINQTPQSPCKRRRKHNLFSIIQTVATLQSRPLSVAPKRYVYNRYQASFINYGKDPLWYNNASWDMENYRAAPPYFDAFHYVENSGSEIH